MACDGVPGCGCVPVNLYDGVVCGCVIEGGDGAFCSACRGFGPCDVVGGPVVISADLDGSCGGRARYLA